MKKPYITLLLFLLLLSTLLIGCGAMKKEAMADDMLFIKEISIGESTGTAERREKDGETEYVIVLTLPVDTDFQNCVVNLTLAEGATLSEESPCLKAELGGRPVLDLTVAERELIIENAGQSQAYSFEIELSR